MPDGVVPPDPAVVANREKLIDRLIVARQQGASWDQIHQSIAGRVAAARSRGATDDQINHALGFTNPDELIAATQAQAQQHLAANKPTSWTDALVSGLTHSSTAALLGVKPSDAPIEGHARQVVAGLAESVGDLPASLIGGVVGAVTGGTVGGAGGAETGPGAVVTAAGGAYFGAAAGATAAPQLIKSERDRYMSALTKGQVKGPEDFLHIQAQVLKDTAEAAGVGLATAGAGKIAGPVLDKMGAGKVTKFLGTVGAEATTMATAQSALAGRMPRIEDVVDAAVTIGAFHVAAKVVKPSSYSAIRQRVTKEYVETGEHPTDIANRAVNDPVFRAKMLGLPDPEIPPGSSRTHVALPYIPEPGKVLTQHSPLPPDQYIIPRTVGDFDHALPWMFKEEGGLTTDTGGVTKYGISAKAHPGVDIAHLSRDDAAEIYHREYWRAIDADALPPNMRLAAFDSAVNQGVGQTKTWLKEAGGDLQKFMQFRVQKYAELARQPKYAKYAASWAKRLKDLGASDAMAGVVRNGPENVGREFAPEDMAALDMEGAGGGEGGGGGKEPPSSSGGAEPERDPWAYIKGRVAPDEGTDWRSSTIETFKRIYGELFDPEHPVRKLVDTATKGDPLDDARNPEFLRRVAENSNEVAKAAISRGMVDMEGKTVGPSLEDIMSGKSVGQKFSNEDTANLEAFARARHALMLEKKGKASGIDIEQAKAVLAEGDAKYGEAFKHLVDYRNSTLKWLEGTALSKSQVDQLIKDNPDGIAGYRRMDDGSYRITNTGKPGIWNPVKKAEGSERQFEPLWKSMMQDTFLRHQIAVNGRAMIATADLAIKAGEAKQSRPINFDTLNAIDELKEKGIDDDVLSSLVKSVGRSLPKDEVPVLRDGKLYGVKFEDPELAKVLMGFDTASRSTTMRVIAAVTKIPRNLQTRYNPLFPVKLALYDIPFQDIVNPDSKWALSSYIVGLGEMIGNRERYQEWLQSGGADHVFSALSSSDYIKNVMKGHEDLSLGDGMWNAVKTSPYNPFNALTAWTRLVGTPLRYGRYVQGIKAGDDPLRATVASTEAAFHRPGFGGTVGKAWNSIVPYTTAHLNGLDKSFKALMGVGRTVTGVPYNAKQTWARGIAMITSLVVAQWFAYKDEEWYKAAPEWQKNTTWIWVPPTKVTAAIPIPAPPIISEIFVALPRMLLEGFVADNPHAADDIWETLGATLMPPGALFGASILQPIVEHIANYSFHRGSPLVSPDTVRGVQPAEQFTPYSSPAAKALAQFASDLPLVHSNFGWSPAIIDNYISQWGGVMGRTAANAAAAVLDRPSNPPPEQRVSDWPGVSSWVVRYPSASAEPIQQFYDTTTRLTQEHGSLLKQVREGNFDAFKRIVDQGGPSAAAWQQLNLGSNIPPGVDLGPYLGYLAQAAQGADYQNLALAHQAADALKNARDYSWSVYEDHGKTGHDKRQILDMTNAQMQVIAERGNEAMDRAMVGVKRPGRSAQVPVPDSIYFQPPQEQ